jgi:hypothetical protein
VLIHYIPLGLSADYDRQAQIVLIRSGGFTFRVAEYHDEDHTLHSKLKELEFSQTRCYEVHLSNSRVSLYYEPLYRRLLTSDATIFALPLKTTASQRKRIDNL